MKTRMLENNPNSINKGIAINHDENIFWKLLVFVEEGWFPFRVGKRGSRKRQKNIADDLDWNCIYFAQTKR